MEFVNEKSRIGVMASGGGNILEIREKCLITV